MKVAICVAAVLVITAGLWASPEAEAEATPAGGTSFRRSDQNASAAAPPLDCPESKALTVVAPDGRYQAISAGDGRIRYARTRDGKVERIFYACAPMVLAFSAQGKLLSCAGTCHTWGGSEGFTVKIWSLAGRDWPTEINVPGKWAEAIAVAGDRVVVSSEANIHCYLYPEGTMEWSASKTEGLCGLKFSEDEQSVLVAFNDGSFTSYDARSGARRE